MTIKEGKCYTNSNTDLYIRISNIKEVNDKSVKVVGFVFNKNFDYFYGVNEYDIKFEKVKDWFEHKRD